ncbi:MAG: DnaJ domain-containing protein [Myxococcota bacterium]
MVQRRILLVVDGDPLRRAELNKLMSTAPHSLVYALDEEDGLDRFHEVRPDAVLLAASRVDAPRLAGKISQKARELGVLLFVMHERHDQLSAEERAQAAPSTVDGILPQPLDSRACERVLKEISLKRAAQFAATALELELDSALPSTAMELDAASSPDAPDEPTTLSGLDQRVVAAALNESPSADTVAPLGPPPVAEPTMAGDVELPAAAEGERTPPEGTPAEVIQQALKTEDAAAAPPAPPDHNEPTPASVEEPAAPAAASEAEPSKTDVGTGPEGLEQLREAVASGKAAPEPQAEEDVFASSGGAPAATQPAVDLLAHLQHVVERADELAAGALIPRADPPLPVLPVGEGPPVPPNAVPPRKLKTDAPPLPRDVEVIPLEGETTALRRTGLRPDPARVHEDILGREKTRRVMAVYRLLDRLDLYQLLGVERTASADDVMAAFHALSLEFHPDRYTWLPSGALRDRLTAIYRRVTEAFRVLSDPQERAAYEELLRVGSHPAPPEVVPPAPEREAAPPPPPSPSSSVVVDDAPPPVRPALQPSDTPAFRVVVPTSKPQVRSRLPTPANASLPSPPHTPAPSPPPPPAAPAEPAANPEDDATTPGGKKFLKLALQALNRNDLNGARLNLTFALGYEPENAGLKRRLSEVEGKLVRPAAR